MDLSDGKSKMDEVVSNLRLELGKIRAGRANPNVLDGVEVEAYDSKMPISHVATISVPDPRTLVIQPWDDTVIKSIEKALQSADIGMMPVVDGKCIRLKVPQLTAEVREEFVREMKERVEDARVAIRGIRHKILDAVEEQAKAVGVSEDDVKRRKDEVEREVLSVMNSIDEMAESKEKELTTL